MSMHTYARNSTVHPTLFAMISLAAIGIAWAFGSGANLIVEQVGVPVSGISAVSLFGLLWLLFDKHLWKIGFVRRMLLVPDLNGSWTCAGRTISKGNEAVDYKWDATVTISQSWSKILVRLETSQSESVSIAASLYQEGEGRSQRHRLIYHYANDPRPSETELKRHTGLTVLSFDNEAKTASGRYFTDGDRLTVGEMHLTRAGAKR